MLVLVPIAALCTYVLALRARRLGWREAVLGGALLWGVVLVGITEGLSAFHALALPGLIVAWLVALLPGVAFVVRSRSRLRLAWRPQRLDRLQLALLLPLGLLLCILASVALLSPPNTWDSMTYHMARVAHWSLNASLDPYPTHILRQLYLPPGAELVIFHLQVLSGGDHLAGLVQWASMVGVLVGTSLIAHALGAGRYGALCASVMAASVPIGVLESTSTQNDYVVALWLVCGALFALRITLHRGSHLPWTLAAALGASVGLAMLAKATAYLFILPVLLWVTASVIRRSRWRGFCMLAVAGAIALSLNAGFYTRNVLVFGSPLGLLDEGSPAFRYLNSTLTPALVASNLVRDVGLNVVATPSMAINVYGADLVRLIHAWLGVDIADPSSTWGGEIFTERPIGLALDENFASNPVHLVLILIALGAVCLRWRALRPSIVPYALALIGGFLLFVTVLRWQPWHTRLELPLFVLGAPLVGAVAERIAPRLAVGLAVLLMISMLPWVVANQARPLVGPRSILGVSRVDQYFTNRPDLRPGYLGALGFLIERGCSRVGFVSTADGWEYPLWALLPGVTEIEHLVVTNVSAAQASPANIRFQPCAVVALGPTAPGESIERNGATYRPRWIHVDPLTPSEQVAVLTEDER